MELSKPVQILIGVIAFGCISLFFINLKDPAQVENQFYSSDVVMAAELAEERLVKCLDSGEDQELCSQLSMQVGKKDANAALFKRGFAYCVENWGKTEAECRVLLDTVHGNNIKEEQRDNP